MSYFYYNKEIISLNYVYSKSACWTSVRYAQCWNVKRVLTHSSGQTQSKYNVILTLSPICSRHPFDHNAWSKSSFCDSCMCAKPSSEINCKSPCTFLLFEVEGCLMPARYCCQSQCNITSSVLWKLCIPHSIFSYIGVNIMLCSVTWFWNCCLDPLSNTADMVEHLLIWMSTNSTYFSLPWLLARITSVNMTPWSCDHLWHTSPLLQCIYQPDIALSCFINKHPHFGSTTSGKVILCTLVMTVKHLSVEYKKLNESGTFSPGDILTGKVTVVTRKETKVQCLLVKAKGKAEVTWYEHEGQATGVYSNKKIYFYFEHIILQDKNEGDG